MEVLLFESIILIPFLILAYYSLRKTKGTQNNEIADGTHEAFFDNGQIKKRRVIKNGKLNGLYEDFYENGQLKLTTLYKDDEKVGYTTAFYENGQLKMRDNFKDLDNLNGIWELYREDGSLLKIEECKDNKAIYQKFFDEEGNLTKTINFKDGERDSIKMEVDDKSDLI